MSRNDILAQSRGWEVLQGGIPKEVQPDELRAHLHAHSNVLTVVVSAINELLDARDDDRVIAKNLAVSISSEDDREFTRIHQRIDRRGDEADVLKERLFDSEKGVVPLLARKTDVSRLTVMLWGILVSVTTAAILLAVNLIVGRP